MYYVQRSSNPPAALQFEIRRNRYVNGVVDAYPSRRCAEFYCAQLETNAATLYPHAPLGSRILPRARARRAEL